MIEPVKPSHSWFTPPIKERSDRLRTSANHNHDDRKKVNGQEEHQETPIAFHLGKSPSRASRVLSTDGRAAVVAPAICLGLSRPWLLAPCALRRCVNPASDIPVTVIRDVVVDRGVLRKRHDISGWRVGEPSRSRNG